MINYTKFRSDLYTYQYCVHFLRMKRHLSLCRRSDLITRSSFAWTELQSDEERFLTSPRELADDEAVIFFRRKLQTLYKLELERNFPSIGAIRDFWAQLDMLWHQQEHSFSQVQRALVRFWQKAGMRPNRHDAGMLSLSSKFLNLLEPRIWPIWDIRRDARRFALTDTVLRDHPEACYKQLCLLVARIRTSGHMRLYRAFMGHLLALHTVALPPLLPLPPLLVLHLLSKRQDSIGTLAVTPALAMEWETIRHLLAADMEGCL